MSEGQDQSDVLKARWDLCKAQDDEKHSLISSLFERIVELSGKLSEAELEVRDKKVVIRSTRDELDEAQKQIQALQLEKDRLIFASVIIDGDCMPFNDVLVKEGLDGGKRTANLLKQAVEEELKATVPTAAHHLKVFIRVYANVKGMSKTYKDMEILSEATFDEFVRGFNMGDTMCDYVDAGNGKECSDEKVKAIFRLHLDDVHCQHIFFGGTADNGYARLLGPYAEGETKRRRITLLEGPPFAREMADIKDRFRTCAVANVFRGQKLFNPNRRVSFHITPPTTPSVDYASAAAKGSTTPARHQTTQQSSTSSRVPVSQQVLRNKQGHRVDAPLTYSNRDFVTVKSRKLCNNFHLLGNCHYLDTYGHCQHEHGDRLSGQQVAALRAVARLNPCPSGLNCGDSDCIYGHRCIRDNCVPTTCRFSQAMHNVDTKIDC